VCFFFYLFVFDPTQIFFPVHVKNRPFFFVLFCFVFVEKMSGSTPTGRRKTPVRAVLSGRVRAYDSALASPSASPRPVPQIHALPPIRRDGSVVAAAGNNSEDSAPPRETDSPLPPSSPSQRRQSLMRHDEQRSDRLATPPASRHLSHHSASSGMKPWPCVADLVFLFGFYV
jgi:hypothetical protein